MAPLRIAPPSYDLATYIATLTDGTLAATTDIQTLQATIVRQSAILNSGMTQVLENGRMVRIDLATVRDAMNANVTALARLTGTAPQVRRIFVSTPRRGY